MWIQSFIIVVQSINATMFCELIPLKLSCDCIIYWLEKSLEIYGNLAEVQNEKFSFN